MPKPKTANSVQPHTEEKLRFYIHYLSRYLQILLRSAYVSRINIYDMYCGAGVYEDGKKGSAMLAVDSIWSAQSANQNCKPINLHLNDLNTNKIENIKSLLATRESHEKRFSISYSSLEAEILIEKLSVKLQGQDSDVRNMVFVDPYGYKSIKATSLKNVMENGRTEIILFLPIEQMYRFKNLTDGEEVEASYRPLKNFIDQFQIDVKSIGGEAEFIDAVELALTFNGVNFATSYRIKNHTGHLYAMFFITSNIYGLEKIVEVKWELDGQGGEVFTGSPQPDFVLEIQKQSELEDLLNNYLAEGMKNNIELYEFVLKAAFLPKHANKIFRLWQSQDKLKTVNLESNTTARKNSFKLNYAEYKSNKPLIGFTVL